MNKKIILRAAAAAVIAAALLTIGCLKTHTDSEGWTASHVLTYGSEKDIISV